MALGFLISALHFYRPFFAAITCVLGPSCFNLQPMDDNSFIIIPTAILANKELSHLAKLLFGKVLSGAQKEGYSWATNKYLASCLGVTAGTISKALGKLESAGLLRIEIQMDGSGTHRKLYPMGVVKKAQGGSQKRLGGYDETTRGGSQKELGGVVENDYPKEEITIRDNKEEIKEEEQAQAPSGPEGLKYYQATMEVAEYFSSILDASFRMPKTKTAFRKYGLYKAVRRLLEAGFQIEEVPKVLKFKKWEWANDDKMRKFLTYQTLLIPDKFEKYLQQRTNETNRIKQQGHSTCQPKQRLGDKYAQRAAKRLGKIGN